MTSVIVTFSVDLAPRVGYKRCQMPRRVAESRHRRLWPVRYAECRTSEEPAASRSSYRCIPRIYRSISGRSCSKSVAGTSRRRFRIPCRASRSRRLIGNSFCTPNLSPLPYSPPLVLRGETFFPVPCLLAARPELLGYYRLLYGISQKEFYKRGYSTFRSMEMENEVSDVNQGMLSQLCLSLCQTGSQLLVGVQPASFDAIHELQLLTIGPQLRGSQNNRIGSKATKEVFDLVGSLIGRRHIQSSTTQVIEVKNAAGRIVQIAFAPDPDITIIERIATTEAMPNTSIEIKGGTDVSNVHNRIGEAEKSHLKAKAEGFTRFWTIVRARIDLEAAKQQSPTTTEFFNLDDIQDKSHAAYRRFRAVLHQVVGIR